MSTALELVPQPAARAAHRLGRYQLVAPLGQGGMGTIHLAVAGGLADFRKLLVVKELRQDLSASRSFVEMFFDEAKLAARLNHPNVVQTLEAGQEDDRYFLTMEFLDGQPFSAVQARLPLTMQLKILCDALLGLHYAHELTELDGTPLRIVHRDVSPQNIFVTYEGQVKVVDFGIAKAAVSGVSNAPGVFKGKLGYAAPEQVRGATVDARSDVFSLGVVLWETLTARRFADEPEAGSRGACGAGPAAAAVIKPVTKSAVMKRLYGQEPRIAQLGLPIDPRLAAICDRALEVEPDARYATAEALRLALEDYLAQDGAHVTSAAIREQMLKKFAAERRETHRLIDRHSKHGAEPQPLGAAERGNDNPTQVADLARYVRHSQGAVPLLSGINRRPMITTVPPSPRPSRLAAVKGPLLWALGGAAVAVTIGLGVLRATHATAPVPVAQAAASVAAASLIKATSQTSALQPTAADVPSTAAIRSPSPEASATAAPNSLQPTAAATTNTTSDTSPSAARE